MQALLIQVLSYNLFDKPPRNTTLLPFSTFITTRFPQTPWFENSLAMDSPHITCLSDGEAKDNKVNIKTRNQIRTSTEELIPTLRRPENSTKEQIPTQGFLAVTKQEQGQGTLGEGMCKCSKHRIPRQN